MTDILDQSQRLRQIANDFSKLGIDVWLFHIKLITYSKQLIKCGEPGSEDKWCGTLIEKVLALLYIKFKDVKILNFLAHIHFYFQLRLTSSIHRMQIYFQESFGVSCLSLVLLQFVELEFFLCSSNR